MFEAEINTNSQLLGEHSLWCVFAEMLCCWQGARAERLTVSVMLPDRQDADDWLKNLWSTFTTRRHNYGGNLSIGVQQRKVKAADSLLVDAGLLKVEGASGLNVRQSTHREIPRRLGCSASLQIFWFRLMVAKLQCKCCCLWCFCVAGCVGVVFVFCFVTREIFKQVLPFPAVDRPCLNQSALQEKQKYGGDSVHRAQNFNSFSGSISRAVSETTDSPKLLLRMWYDPIRSYVGFFFWSSSHTAATRRTCSWNLKVTLAVAVTRETGG